MSLPVAWVDRLFERLTLAYGRDFSGRWEGVSVDAVKADWAERLAGYVNAPDALAWALDNLPMTRPPTVLEFAALCARAPVKPVLSLPAPDTVAKPEAVKAALAGLSLNRTPAGRQWAEKLREREERESRGATGSARLTQFQRDAWREALGHGQESEEA